MVNLRVARERTQYETGQRPRHAKPHAGIARRPAHRRERPPRFRPGTPRKAEQRQHRQVPPALAPVRDARDEATDRLADEDLVPIRRTTGHTSRDGPEQCATDAKQHRTGEREVPRGPVPVAARCGPPRREHRRRQHVQQNLRPLGEQTERDARGEERHAATAAMLDRMHDTQQRQQRRAGQQRVDRQQRPEDGPHHRAGRDHRCPAARARIAPPERTCHRRHQPQRRDAGDRCHQPRPQLAHSQHFPPCEDQPEEQRRQFAGGSAAEVRNQPVAALQHFECHGHMLCLIDRHRRTGEEPRPRHERHEACGHGDSAAAWRRRLVHAHASVTARRDRPRVRASVGAQAVRCHSGSA